MIIAESAVSIGFLDSLVVMVDNKEIRDLV